MSEDHAEVSWAPVGGPFEVLATSFGPVDQDAAGLLTITITADGMMHFDCEEDS